MIYILVSHVQRIRLSTTDLANNVNSNSGALKKTDSNVSVDEATLDDMIYFRTNEPDTKNIIETIESNNEPVIFTFNDIGTERNNRKPCQAPTNLDLQRYKDDFHGVPLYTGKNANVTDSMRQRANQLANILGGIATEVFHMQVTLMNLYQGAEGNDLSRKLS
jgi:hypothetical protein